MSLTNQPGAYADCYEIWRAAEASVAIGGIRVDCGPRYNDAQYLMARLHQARSLLRKQSRRAFPTTDPKYDTSEFDFFKVTLKTDTTDNNWLYIEPHGNWTALANIEPIPIPERTLIPDLSTYTPPRRLEHAPSAPPATDTEDLA